MKVYLNTEGELTCSEPQASTTVSELICAVESFCQENVDCTNCINTCCAGFIVFADHIFLKKLTALAKRSSCDQDAPEFAMRSVCWDSRSAKWFVPQGPDGKCQFLSRQGRCLIYEARPLVCRLHVCYKAETGYKEMKDDLYYAYHEAAKTEMSLLLARGDRHAAGYSVSDNPVYWLDNYGAVIQQVRVWAKFSRTQF